MPLYPVVLGLGLASVGVAVVRSVPGEAEEVVLLDVMARMKKANARHQTVTRAAELASARSAGAGGSKDVLKKKPKPIRGQRTNVTATKLMVLGNQIQTDANTERQNKVRALSLGRTTIPGKACHRIGPGICNETNSTAQ
jgi:hypothetical protein